MALFRRKKHEKFINSSGYKICSRCGRPIKDSDRYCLKCGALNFDHPDNQYLKKYMSFKKIEKENRQKLDNTMEQKVTDVYVGGEKLEETSIKDKEKEEKDNTYREVITISPYLVVAVLIAVALLIYFLIVK